MHTCTHQVGCPGFAPSQLHCHSPPPPYTTLHQGAVTNQPTNQGAAPAAAKPCCFNALQQLPHPMLPLHMVTATCKDACGCHSHVGGCKAAPAVALVSACRLRMPSTPQGGELHHLSTRRRNHAVCAMLHHPQQDPLLHSSMTNLAAPPWPGHANRRMLHTPTTPAQPITNRAMTHDATATAAPLPCG